MEFAIFVLGLIFGSFANVCIYRLPKGKSIIFPGSFCPQCGNPIKWYDNIPLLSYIILKGKCRICKKPISVRYFIVELITGLLFLLIYQRFKTNLTIVPVYYIFVISLIIISFIDMDTFLIPDVIVIPGIFLGILFSYFFPGLHNMEKIKGLTYSISGTFLGGGILLFLGFVGKILFKKDAMGGGDVKLLGMIGAFLGWKIVLTTLFLASFIGTLVSLLLILFKKKTFEDYVPFGPYLAAGAIISIFLKGTKIYGFYLN